MVVFPTLPGHARCQASCRGAWSVSHANFFACLYRLFGNSVLRYDNVGFRCARTSLENLLRKYIFMYPTFYQLKKAPFHITPDPEFLFLSASHKSALGALVYGIEERQGFVALIGEVGLGKTTILRSYLERVDQQQLKTVYIFNPNVSFGHLLKMLYRELDLEVPGNDIVEQINHLHQALIDEYKMGHNIALIIDEAQNMPVETLEKLHMLSNLETSTEKLLQIVLVGQPEFGRKLELYELRQLKQRLVIRTTLVPLTEEEGMAYIQHRLAKVALLGQAIFTTKAMRAIVRQARGTPRVINILCTNALIRGFDYRKELITAKIVNEVIDEHRGTKRASAIKPWLAATLGVLVVGGAVWLSPYRQSVLAGLSRFEYVQRWTSRLWPDFANSPPVTEEPLGTTTRTATPKPERGVSESTSRTPGSERSISSAPANQSRSEAVQEGPRSIERAVPDKAGLSPLPLTVKTVKRGDQLTTLAQEVYGVSNAEIIQFIRKNNPQIQDANRIEIGLQIVFPPLPQ